MTSTHTRKHEHCMNIFYFICLFHWLCKAILSAGALWVQPVHLVCKGVPALEHVFTLTGAFVTCCCPAHQLPPLREPLLVFQQLAVAVARILVPEGPFEVLEALPVVKALLIPEALEAPSRPGQSSRLPRLCLSSRPCRSPMSSRHH